MVESESFQIVNRTTIVNEETTLNSGIWDMITRSIIDEYDPSDFRQIKIRIRSFVRDHPSIVSQIEKYFSNEILEHVLKKTFRVQFTHKDFQQTKLVYQKYFTEEYSNIEIMISYFLDDIRLLISTKKFENIPWPFRQAIITTSNYILVEVALRWIYHYGSDKFTTMLYENLLKPDENPSTLNNVFSFDQKTVKIFFLLLLFLLLVINIPSIAFIVNCIGVFLFLIFLFVNSFIYLKRYF